MSHIWNGPIAAYRVVRPATDDAEKATLSPIRSPAIPTNPVVDAVFISTPTVQLNGMIEKVRFAIIIWVDASSIIFDTLIVDVACNRSSRHDFFLYVAVSNYSTIL